MMKFLITSKLDNKPPLWEDLKLITNLHKNLKFLQTSIMTSKRSQAFVINSNSSKLLHYDLKFIINIIEAIKLISNLHDDFKKVGGGDLVGVS